MARHLRLEYAGDVYHVTARGNDRSVIVHSEEGGLPIGDQVVAHRQWRGLSVAVQALLERIRELWGVSLAQIHTRQRPNAARDAAIYLCREVGAKPLREIGDALGITGAAVTLAAKRMRLHVVADQALRNRLDAANNALIQILKT